MLPQCKRSAFTLIELLMAVAVVAVLSVFLFPAIKNSIERSRETQCSSRLRDIGNAVLLYAQDYDMNLPGPLSSPAFGGWYSTLRQKDFQSGNLLGSFVAPYLGMHLLEADGYQARFSEKFVCPSWHNHFGAAASDPTRWMNTCYVVQKRIIVGGERVGYSTPWGTPAGASNNGWDSTPLKMANIDNPAKYWMITELDTAGNLGATASISTPIHGSFRNTVFFDGHVERVPTSVRMYP